MKDKKQAEPQVIYRGLVSDASEHLPMLDNQEANTMADEIAIRQAVESGTFTEAEARALMSGSSEPLLEHIRNRNSETVQKESKTFKDAKTFLDGLRAHLDKNIHPEDVRRWLQQKERDEQYEEAFLDKFVLPPTHEYLCNSLMAADASKAFLTESTAARRRGISSGTPASAKKHPFTKEFSGNKASVVKLWWPKAKTDARGPASTRSPVSQSCPDFSFRDPCPYKVVFEAKLFRKGGIEAAKTTLVGAIYECFHYLGLPTIPESKKHAAWDYDYACLLAYDASENCTLINAWGKVDERVAKGCWNPANVYIMVLPMKE